MIEKDDLELIIHHCEGSLRVPIKDIEVCPISNIQDCYKKYCSYISDEDGMFFKTDKEELFFYKCEYFEKDYKKFIMGLDGYKYS